MTSAHRHHRAFAGSVRFFPRGIWAVIALWVFAGCGTTLNRSATEQILTSDAVDRSVARIDFAPLAGQKVFLDIEYLKNVKGVGTVNAEYVISSLRQQILAAGCLLQENKAFADYVIEARMGALGMDAHEIIYGIPANNALGAASAVLPTVPPAPTIPELAIAKRNDQRAAAKLGVFAYHRITRDVVWQSGTSESVSSSRDAWIAGVGPFQSGTIRKETRFAPGVGLLPMSRPDNNLPSDVRYTETRVFKELEAPPAPVVVAVTGTPNASGKAATPAPTSTSAASPASPSSSRAPAMPAVPDDGIAMAEIPVEALEEMLPEVARSLLIPGQTIQQVGAIAPANPDSLKPAKTLRGSRPISLLELESQILDEAYPLDDEPRSRSTAPDLNAPAKFPMDESRMRAIPPPLLDSTDQSGKNWRRNGVIP